MKRSGMTLIELLIVIAIIGILVSMSYGAIFFAMEAGRGEATRSTITKLHTLIIDRWETYRTRRLVMLVPSAPDTRLAGVREVMRMELPDRYEDLYFAPAASAAPPLRSAYLRAVERGRKKYNAANGTSLNASDYRTTILSTGSNEHESAELLYLVINTSMGTDDRALLSNVPTGDVNGNGMIEYLDAWGRPIHWLRWAPGVVSEVQTHTAISHHTVLDNHDPFDPFIVQAGGSELFDDLDDDGVRDSSEPYIDQNGNGSWDSINENPPPLESGEGPPTIKQEPSGSVTVNPRRLAWGFAILPFIYSGGSDKEYGIQELYQPAPVTAAALVAKNSNPYSRYANAGAYYFRGDPLAVDGDTAHFDNIHNHQPQGQK